MDLDLRLVRAFVEVADAGHFGRAAARLHLAQSAVSRQVQRLEGHLGAPLLERTSRSVRLTEAGRAFLPDARELLRAAEAAQRRVTAHQRLAVGFLPGISPTPAVRRLRQAGHAGEITMLHLEWFEQGEALLDGRIDVCLGRLPIEGDGVRVEPLHQEGRLVLVAAGHRLATRDGVSVADLADEPVVRHEGPVAAAWDCYWALHPRSDGSTIRWGPVVRDLQEKLEYVAAGEAITILPESTASLHDRDDVRLVPLVDGPPATVAVAWLEGGRPSPARDAFLRAVRESMGAGPGAAPLVVEQDRALA